MPDPVEYQVPLPPGKFLRCHELPDGLRISRDLVSQFGLWREFLIPLILVGFLVCAVCYAGYQGWQAWQRRETVFVIVWITVGILCPVSMFPWIRGAWQNAGLVTAIAVTNGALYWQKRTLWGESDHIWPLSTVRGAFADRLNRLLKIERTDGPPLGAFAYCSREELETMAKALNQAIEKHRLPTGEVL